MNKMLGRFIAICASAAAAEKLEKAKLNHINPMTRFFPAGMLPCQFSQRTLGQSFIELSMPRVEAATTAAVAQREEMGSGTLHSAD